MRPHPLVNLSPPIAGAATRAVPECAHRPVVRLFSQVSHAASPASGKG